MRIQSCCLRSSRCASVAAQIARRRTAKAAAQLRVVARRRSWRANQDLQTAKIQNEIAMPAQASNAPASADRCALREAAPWLSLGAPTQPGGKHIVSRVAKGLT